MPDCGKWGETRHQECSQTRDDGYSKCSQSRDEGYSSCSSWGWWSWLCDAWTWVSNIVCVAWTWISNVVCVAWTWITTAVCLVWDVVTTAIDAVITVIESTLGWVLDILAFVIDVLFLIPYVGRFLQELWNGVLFLVYTILSLPDMILGALGIRPEKILRLGVVYFTINGTPIGNVDDFIVSAGAGKAAGLAFAKYRFKKTFKALKDILPG